MASGSVYGAIFGALITFISCAFVLYRIATRVSTPTSVESVQPTPEAEAVMAGQETAGSAKASRPPPTAVLAAPEPSEWSGAQLYQEYIKKAGMSTDNPQYVVFNTQKGGIEFAPAPAADAPYLKLHPDGKAELIKPPANKQKNDQQQQPQPKNNNNQQQQQQQQQNHQKSKEQPALVEGTIELSKFFDLITKVNGQPGVSRPTACTCSSLPHGGGHSGCPGPAFPPQAYYWHPSATPVSQSQQQVQQGSKPTPVAAASTKPDKLAKPA
ncbi:uncharacterized protein PFL1_02037 [Pseudozyma flocculosa PF-1]|uniref:uncharacterized protein n=1 Tax=Pseudozyma flocculosa PF-1 TaxID=1277687 RepID=UPI00045614E6|nr:uncharacterized protein PFL1_02037 [Pseudozyma flocculosa PF-1]EPQ30511.1 hypothetical protein PFL1_02037 [Pseudozyma flocculosa PF-1]